MSFTARTRADLRFGGCPRQQLPPPPSATRRSPSPTSTMARPPPCTWLGRRVVAVAGVGGAIRAGATYLPAVSLHILPDQPLLRKNSATTALNLQEPTHSSQGMTPS